MKVLLTGATGFVGESVIQALLGAGHEVRALVRDAHTPTARQRIQQYRIQLAESSLHDPQPLRRALNGIEAVIHLVGLIAPTRQQTFDLVHVEATRNLVEAARAAGTQRFVHMSALGSRPQAASRYHQTKFAAENIVRQSGLPFTIFRPSIIYGAGDQFVNSFARLIRRSPLLPLIGSGRGRLQPIAVDEVALCFVRALERPEAVGQTYALCGPKAYTLEEILDLISHVLQRRRVRWRVPGPLAWSAAWTSEWLFGQLLNRPPPLTRDQLIMLEEENASDPEPAARTFGFQPRSFTEGISRYLQPQ